MSKPLSEHAAAMARARWAKTTPEQRSEAGRHAAHLGWKKRKRGRKRASRKRKREL